MAKDDPRVVPSLIWTARSLATLSWPVALEAVRRLIILILAKCGLQSKSVPLWETTRYQRARAFSSAQTPFTLC